MNLPRGTEARRAEEAPNARFMTKQERAQHSYQATFEAWKNEPKNKENRCPVLLGKDAETDELIGVADDRHLMTVAGSRSGKSSTCLKPNLLLWPSSILCLDPKGELAAFAAEHREAMGQDVFVLDPFNATKGTAAEKYQTSFNLLDELREGSEDDLIDDAAMLADSLIVPDKGGDSHWTSAAKNLLRGLILYALLNPETSLNDIRHTLTLPQKVTKDDDTEAQGKADTLSSAFTRMQAVGDALGGVVAGGGSTMIGKPENERGSIISTAIEQTAFLDSMPMQRHLQGRGLPSLRNLKRKPTTVRGR